MTSEAITIYLATVGSAEGGEAAADMSITSMLLEADLIVQGVLFILLGMSVFCWWIIFKKYKRFKAAVSSSRAFTQLFWGSRQLTEPFERVEEFRDAPIAQVFRKGYIELQELTQEESDALQSDMTENVQRTLRVESSKQLEDLASMIPVLATTGSTAPFIGLFGTVWGILRAFQKIGVTGQATLETVGPDIAHALIATAVGLAAAIPAVIAFNFFTTQVQALQNDMENFSADFMNIVKRHFRRT